MSIGNMRTPALGILAAAAVASLTLVAQAGNPHLVVYRGDRGPGVGKHIVWLAGDHEYRGDDHDGHGLAGDDVRRESTLGEARMHEERGQQDADEAADDEADDRFLPRVERCTDEVPEEMWRDSLTFFAQMVSPWVAMTDPAKFTATVDAIAALSPSVIAGGHMAALRGERLHEGMRLLRALPTTPLAPLPTQADLDTLLLAATQAGGSETEAADAQTPELADAGV